MPFLGTCAGFQHAVIEFARNVAGRAGAHHAEYEPVDGELVITPLPCSLAGQTMDVTLRPGSRARAAYQRSRVSERYYCTFGMNDDHVTPLVDAGLSITGTGPEGEPRIVELPTHRFFVATLFVPQVASAPGATHPLVDAFVRAGIA